MDQHPTQGASCYRDQISSVSLRAYLLLDLTFAHAFGKGGCQFDGNDEAGLSKEVIYFI